MQRQQRQQGFSLIELLIVVAIVLVIAAMAVPNLVRARMRANETSAIGSIREINNAQTLYITSYPAVGYASDLKSLGPGTPSGVEHAGLLDGSLACETPPCLKSGYSFSMTGEKSSFTINANPMSPNATGKRAFYSDESFVIRVNRQGDPAKATDNPI